LNDFRKFFVSAFSVFALAWFILDLLGAILASWMRDNHLTAAAVFFLAPIAVILLSWLLIFLVFTGLGFLMLLLGMRAASHA